MILELNCCLNEQEKIYYDENGHVWKLLPSGQGKVEMTDNDQIKGSTDSQGHIRISTRAAIKAYCRMMTD